MSDNITLPREVVQEALEALEHAGQKHGGIFTLQITMLRAALAAPKQSKPKCGTCSFYEQDEDSTFRGACRFRLPSHLVTGMNSVQAYIDRCDLHKPKEGGT